MKKIKYIFLVSVATSCYSCNDYLDVNPDNRTTLDSKEALQELLVSAYPSAQYYHICEVLSDNVAERNVVPTTSRSVLNEEMYGWSEGYQAGTGQDTPFYVWMACYKAIGAANQALEAIKKAHDPSAYRAQKGEALVCRAYIHFLLVNIWALHYDPATAPQLLGIPYNEEPENVAIKYYKRNSIAEVYALIEKDLIEGLPLINDNDYSVPKYHFTRAAAHAFASRFYQYKGEWDKVIDHATNALPQTNIADKLLDLPGREMYEAASTDYRQKYRRVDQPNILLLVGAMSWWARDARSSSYVQIGMSSEQNSLYQVGSVTGNAPAYYRRWGSSSSLVYYTEKLAEHWQASSPGSTSGWGWVMGAHFTIEEAILNRAEAYAMKGDLTRALADVDILIGKRVTTGRTATSGGNPNPPPPPVTLAQVKSFYDNKPAFMDLDPFYASDISEDQMSVLKHIVHWRRLEFMQEGLRWFDIKRFRLEVTHSYPFSNKPDNTLAKNDPRRALQIPMEAQEFGVEPNPR